MKFYWNTTILLFVCQVCGGIHATTAVLSSCYKAFLAHEPKITLSDSLQKSLPVSVLEHSARPPGLVFSLLCPILLFNRNSGPRSYKVRAGSLPGWRFINEIISGYSKNSSTHQYLTQCSVKIQLFFSDLTHFLSSTIQR